MPEGVVHAYIDPATGLLASPACPGEGAVEVFLEGTEPLRSCGPLGSAIEVKPNREEQSGRSWWRKLRGWWRS